MKKGNMYLRWLVGVLLCGAFSSAQGATVTARVAWDEGGGNAARAHETGNVVLWLTPIDSPGAPISAPAQTSPRIRLVQKNKSFEPHVLVVPVGSLVEFPNRDPFFHNVFSLFEGKRFDLGLYEAGSSRDVHFDKPGVSYIFCNIHPEMSAVVIAVETRYYATSDARGDIAIRDVPAGRYTLRVWYEAALAETLNSMTREITVSEDNLALGALRLASVKVAQSHKNKYGRDYDPPAPDSPAYQHP
ncbi:MAG TPA: carboxypeptidase regulatory-like domain-containing protein [Terriglobales bacterium]|nr:carboxypeptidase regulatory-like domain-containing protein [Terriglobales bacterium]